MLFNLCLHCKGLFLTSAATAATLIFLISSIKEKCDERKRA